MKKIVLLTLSLVLSASACGGSSISCEDAAKIINNECKDSGLSVNLQCNENVTDELLDCVDENEGNGCDKVSACLFAGLK